MSSPTVAKVQAEREGALPAAEPRPEQSAAAPSPFPPIADYAFLSDCHTGALVAPDGSIEWLCVPAFDAPSVFGALRGPPGRLLPVRPLRHRGADRADLARYNVLVTTWKVPTGWLEVREALVMGPRRGEDTVTPHTRPPTDFDGEHLLVRTARCLSGVVQVELVCEPVFDYGRSPAEWTLENGERHVAVAVGRRTARRAADGPAAGDRGRHGTGAPRAPAPVTRCSARCRGGRSSPRPATSRPRPRSWLTTTEFWRTWMDSTRFPDHRWRGAIQRSALAIKGLTYMPTGATIAALTTSLPETPGGERNWDYRYTWMRDTTFTLQALHWLQLDWEADEFMQFVADLEPNEDGSLQIMYGIDGRRDLTESTRDELTGYAGASPVRIGNGAFDQRQNDVYGAVLDSILLHTNQSQRCRGGCGRSWSRRPRARWRRAGCPTRGSGRRAASRATTCPRS